MKLTIDININFSSQAGNAEVLAELANINSSLIQLKENLRVTKEEIIAAIAASQDTVKQHIAAVGADVTAKFNDLNQQIQDLLKKVAAGNDLSLADFQPLIDTNTQLATAVDAIDPNTAPPAAPATT